MKKKDVPRKFESQTLGLPPLTMVLANVPTPDPKRSPRVEMEERAERSKTILRLIEFFSTQQ